MPEKVKKDLRRTNSHSMKKYVIGGIALGSLGLALYAFAPPSLGDADRDYFIKGAPVIEQPVIGEVSESNRWPAVQCTSEPHFLLRRTEKGYLYFPIAYKENQTLAQPIKSAEPTELVGTAGPIAFAFWERSSELSYINIDEDSDFERKIVPDNEENRICNILHALSEGRVEN